MGAWLDWLVSLRRSSGDTHLISRSKPLPLAFRLIAAAGGALAFGIRHSAFIIRHSSLALRTRSLALAARKLPLPHPYSPFPAFLLEL